ncbi:Sporulation regulator WhiA [Thermodesulfobium narugense DSM 14796]|uniref:Sporulation regulator WhiA n=1 Tax=Thermodesulfobium narugense DSM 14796 TaxID=747365 RepID=M1E7E2_9BACT|nr:DNA-binding protein WhiA [Thermodesulfobium narugense]AEE15236.1 Sporulation regulator WhiA [Thermodesulfobium narugense DSM 14796]
MLKLKNDENEIIRSEIASLPIENKRLSKFELKGIMLSHSKANDKGIIIKCKNFKVAKRTIMLAHFLNIKTELYQKSKKSKNSQETQKTTMVKLEKFLLPDPPETFPSQKSIQSFLRGLFLNSGYLSTKNGYHLEIITNSEIFGFLSALLEEIGFNFKIRKANSYSLFLKNFNEIVSFLAYIQVHNFCAYLEAEAIKKEANNEINREVNYETGNIKRQIKASLEILRSINILESSENYYKLPIKWQKMMALKKDHPLFSMKEIGEHLGMSKNQVSSVFRQIRKLTFNL